jgi:hypothetical protein
MSKGKNIGGYLAFYMESDGKIKQKLIPKHLKDLFLKTFEKSIKESTLLWLTGEEIEEFLTQNK